MIDIEVRQETMEEIKKLQKKYKELEQVSKKALKFSTNRIVARIKTEAKKKVREDYAIKAGEVSSSFKPDRENGLITTLFSKGPTVSFSKLKLSPAKNSGHRQKVKVGVKKGASSVLKHAFVRTFASSHTGAMERTTNSRYPIEEIKGPSVPQMLGNDKIFTHLQEVAENEWPDRFEHELNRLLGGS